MKNASVRDVFEVNSPSANVCEDGIRIMYKFLNSCFVQGRCNPYARVECLKYPPRDIKDLVSDFW